MSQLTAGSRIRRRQYVFTLHEQLDTFPGTDSLCWKPHGINWESQGVRYIVAGLEKAPTTGRLHWQGYIQLHSPKGINGVKTAMGTAQVHLEGARGTPAEAIAYSKKMDTAVLAEDGSKVLFEWGDPVMAKQEKMSRDDAYRKVLEAGSKDEAMALFMELAPKDYVVYNQQMRRVLDDKFGKRLPKIRDMSTFTYAPIPKERLDKQSVVLRGMSGAGKTAFALAHFKKPLLIRHIDQLKDFNPNDYDGLVFDDMSFNHWPPEANIHLFDLENDSHINCRYNTGFIPAGFHRIFTTNKEIDKFVSSNIDNEEQNQAIMRRLHIVPIVRQLY